MGGSPGTAPLSSTSSSCTVNLQVQVRRADQNVLIRCRLLTQIQGGVQVARRGGSQHQAGSQKPGRGSWQSSAWTRCPGRLDPEPSTPRRHLRRGPQAQLPWCVTAPGLTRRTDGRQSPPTRSCLHLTLPAWILLALRVSRPSRQSLAADGACPGESLPSGCQATRPGAAPLPGPDAGLFTDFLKTNKQQRNGGLWKAPAGHMFLYSGTEVRQIGRRAVGKLRPP